MTPSSTELSIAPGHSTTNSFDVINEGDTNYTVLVSVAPYHVAGTDYDPEFTPLPGTIDASNWVRITDPTAKSLVAHKLINVNYTITVPEGTQPGGYYAVLFAETGAPATSASTGVVSHNRVGNILYISVQGPVKTGGTVQTVGVPHITTAASLPLAMLVSNTGGVHFLTSASVAVKNIFGKSVFHTSLQRYVLPQTVRKVSATWNNMPPIGLYRVERSATVAGAKRRLANQWVFIVRPWVLSLLGVIILIIIGETAFKRRRQKKRS